LVLWARVSINFAILSQTNKHTADRIHHVVNIIFSDSFAFGSTGESNVVPSDLFYADIILFVADLLELSLSMKTHTSSVTPTSPVSHTAAKQNKFSNQIELQVISAMDEQLVEPIDLSRTRSSKESCADMRVNYPDSNLAL